jgi:hypothetical protein
VQSVTAASEVQSEAQAVERAVEGMQLVAMVQSESEALLQHPCTP